MFSKPLEIKEYTYFSFSFSDNFIYSEYLAILSFFSIGIYGLIISEIIDIIVVNYLNIKKLHELDYI